MRGKVSEFQEQEAPRIQDRDASWFYSELSKVTNVLEVGDDFKIVCPFHDDHNPSLGVKKTGGYFNCFSCGAGGDWNKLAFRLGMAKLKREKVVSLDSGVQGYKDGISRALDKAGIHAPKRQRRDEDGHLQDKVRPLIEAWPVAKDWRGFDGPFLRREGCLSVHDMAHKVHRVGLPVRRATGELLGYTCRAITPADAKPKYTPLSPDRTDRVKELPAKEALFLIEHVLKDKWDRIILVEGPVDALRLYRMGIPAVAILGTNNWTSIKAAILGSLGLRMIGVLMDNDDSGQDAQEEILTDLRPIARSKGFGLPKSLKDPDEMSDKQLIWLKERLFAA